MAKVYVSSTIADLEAERRAVMEWLRAARHQAVDSYLPDSDTVRESCLEDIDPCDLYVLILGHRYGHQPDGTPDGLSITHLEFRRAAKIPRVALLRTSVPDIRTSDLEDPQRARLVRAFREEVQSELRAAEFSNLKGLVQGLSAGVQHELEKVRKSKGRSEDWLSAQLRDVRVQFASHMASAALRSGASAADLYLELLVRERRKEESKEASSTEAAGASVSHPLADVIASAQSPVLLVGDGGAGKTTSLLYLAARAADRARDDVTASIPIYVNLAKLTRLSDVADLHGLIADSVPLVRDWEELADLIGSERRRVLFLLDSFNEIPEHLQGTAAVVLSRFAEKQQKNHQCVIGSRLAPHVEQLARPPTPFQTVEILRLTPDQVQEFLQRLGLQTLYERLPRELRELASNPFMLSAIAGTLAGKPDAALPRNRGKLYESFVHEWMLRESKKGRGLAYSYERVKEPMLAYIANRMTAAGETSLARTDETDADIEAQLEAIHRRIKRRGGMPEEWTVDRWLEETLGDGLLKRVNERLHFMHQSVQEYFTSVFFRERGGAALVEFTPKHVWEAIPTYELAEVPNHRFVPALLMASGLADDSTPLVTGLAARNPVLAAAALSSANYVQPSLLARLEGEWLELLDHEDEHRRITGCSCLVLASMQSPRVLQRLVAFATGDDFTDSYVGIPALVRLAAFEATTRAIIERARELPFGDGYDARREKILEAVEKLQSPQLVAVLFDSWRSSPENSPSQQILSSLMTAVDPEFLSGELNRVITAGADAAAANDARRALAERPSWRRRSGRVTASRLREIWAQRQKEHEDGVAAALALLTDASDAELAEALGSLDRERCVAAAVVAAKRGAPFADAIIDVILRSDQGWGWDTLLDSLRSLLDEPTLVAKLVGASRQPCRSRGTLGPEVPVPLTLENFEQVKAALMRLGLDERIEVTESMTEGETTVWILRPSSWNRYRPQFELRSTPGWHELFDCNIAARAFVALGEIPGEVARAEVRRAINHERLEVAIIAVEALARARDPEVTHRLLEELELKRHPEFVQAALNTLAAMKEPEAAKLVDQLPLITPAEWSDAHPVWGPCPVSPGWADGIHSVLVGLPPETLQTALDRALGSDDAAPRRVALAEVARLLSVSDGTADHRAAWTTPDRLQRVVDFALVDPSDTVRAAAADALSQIADITEHLLVYALEHGSADVHVAAGEAFARMKDEDATSPKPYTRVAEVMRAVIAGTSAQELRRRAGAVLAKLPGAVDPFHHPIQLALEQNDYESALQLIDSALEIFPADVDLFWWRGHAMRSRGELLEAAASFAHAAGMLKEAVVIPQALAETYLDLGDYSGAVEAARRGTTIAPYDADAQSMLALTCYKAGDLDESIRAAAASLEANPVQPSAIWIAVLAYVRKGDRNAAQSSLQHAQRVWEALSPGLDASFRSEFLKELDSIVAGAGESGSLAADIRQAMTPT